MHRADSYRAWRGNATESQHECAVTAVVGPTNDIPAEINCGPRLKLDRNPNLNHDDELRLGVRLVIMAASVASSCAGSRFRRVIRIAWVQSG